MKKTYTFFTMAMILFCSCNLLHIGAGREEKSGCPSNGKNMGAEKLVTGDPKAAAMAKKAGKFTMTKNFFQ